MQRVLEPEVMDTALDALEYDQMDFAASDGAFARRASELLPPGKGTRVLDVGTGTAKIPVLLLRARPDLTLLCVDLASNMLALAAKNLAQAGLTSRASLERMDAKRLPLPSGETDFVLLNSIVHHIPEPLVMLREVARVLRPGGGLLIRDLARPDTAADAWAIVLSVAPRDSEHQKKLFFDSLCAALTVAEITELAQRAGLTRVAITKPSDRHWSVERSAT